MVRIVEIMWLVIAAISTYEVFARWNTERQNAYMFLAFIALAVFMFYFRRRSRLRYEAKHKKDAEV